MEFMAVSSYGSATSSSGVVRILKDLDRDITGKHVLVVEDIIDSGLTLSWLLSNLAAAAPASLEVCALLRKPDAVKVDVPVKYIGFDIPNEFVIGYGLDYAERYRDLPYIATLKPEVYAVSGLDPGRASDGATGARARQSHRCPVYRRSRRRCTRAPGSSPGRRRRPRTIRRVTGRASPPAPGIGVWNVRRSSAPVWFWVVLVVLVALVVLIALPRQRRLHRRSRPPRRSPSSRAATSSRPRSTTRNRRSTSS